MVFGLEQSAAPCLQRGRVSESFWVQCGRGSHELPCSLRGPGGTRVLSGRQIAQRHLLHRANDGLQSVLVLGHHDSTADGDGGGEDGLHDGGVRVHYGLWQVRFFLSLSFFSAPPSTSSAFASW